MPGDEKMKYMLSPSMMCADLINLGQTLRVFESSGTEYLHIDIMDGHFVPNITLGTDFCSMLKKNCRIPLDIHLMIEKPEDKLSWFDFGAGDIVSVHAESTVHLHKAVAAIKERGAMAFAALNPATGINSLDHVLDDIDGAVVMAVDPGFAGQRMIPSSLIKIKKLRAYFDANGKTDALIEVDGNVSFANAASMKKAGADIFVAGTSSVFSKELTLEEGISRMREILK